jgi:hypothetical protein
MPSCGTPLIIDIEASGLDRRAYPIEVGIALGDEQKFCVLIRPAPGWDYWDESAERMHQITRAQLEEHGVPVREAALRLNEAARGMILYSDGWVVDQPWLIKLFHAARMAMAFRVSPLEMILSESQMARWHQAKEGLIEEMNITRHRASIDAWVVQETYRRTLQPAD